MKSNNSTLSDRPGDHPALGKSGSAFSTAISTQCAPEITPRTWTLPLKNHLAVNYASPSSGRIEDWEWLENGVLRSVQMRGRVTANSAEAYIACCLAGLGLIQIPAYDVRPDLEAGNLVEVLPGFRAEPMAMAILYPTRQHLSRRLHVFADWLEGLLRDAVR